MKTRFLPVVVIVAVIAVIAGLGRSVTAANMGWFGSLNLPWFTPPGWMIGAVWGVIYILSGVAAWRIWNWPVHDERFGWICRVGVVNVLLNCGWSFLFFGAHLMGVSVAAAVVLVVSVGVIIWLAWERDRISAGLLVPYFLWMIFATVLAAGVAWLN